MGIWECEVQSRDCKMTRENRYRRCPLEDTLLDVRKVCFLHRSLVFCLAYHSDEIPIFIVFSLTDLLPMHCAYSNFDAIKIVLS